MDSSRCGADAGTPLVFALGCARQEGHDNGHGFSAKDAQPHQCPPAAVAGTALLPALADLLTAKGTLLFSIARGTDEGTIRITVVPPKNDSDVPILPLQIEGAPDEIEAQLPATLATYVPAIKSAFATADEIAAATAKANEKAKADAAKRAEAARPAPKKGDLTLTVTPADATITLTDAQKKTHAIKTGVATQLPAGSYTVEVSAEGHTTQSSSVTVDPKKPHTLAIALDPIVPDLFTPTSQENA